MNQITEKEREFIENKLKMTTRTIVVSYTVNHEYHDTTLFL